MSKQIEPITLLIEGIDNAFEATHLIRLFHDREPERIDDPATPVSTKGYAVTLRVQERTEQVEAVAHVYHDGILVGEGSHCLYLNAAAKRKSKILYSRKLSAGTALYHALSSAFSRKLPWGSLTGVRPVKLAAQYLELGFSPRESAASLEAYTGMQPEKAELLVAVARSERPLLEPPPDTVSLYVGIPFCTTRCLYCSFPSYPTDRFESLISGYLDALIREIRFTGEWLEEKGFGLSSVYVGGGTPTALPHDSLERLLSELDSALPMHTKREYTVEAGRPDSIDREKLEILRAHRVDRISINPQTMHGDTLARIGRGHTPEQVERAFVMAREAGFANINADLIAGLPGENETHFSETLHRLGRLEPESVTIHTLAVKRASRLYESVVEGTARASTPDEVVAEMLATGAGWAKKRDLHPYYLYRQKHILANLENTGYARPGYACRYNVETMSERQTILALGAGGVTKVVVKDRPQKRVENVRELQHYISRMDEMLSRKRSVLRLFDQISMDNT